MELYNTSDGYQYNLMFQLQRNVSRGVSINTAYTFGEAKDKNSLSSSQAASQMNYSPIDMDPNNPALTTSQWEVKHRVFASVSYAAEFFEKAPTTISLFYNGQSGNPFSFVVNGDLNNDRFKYNDLFYIPKDANDILVGKIVGGNFVAATAPGTTADDLNAFIQNDDYLSKNRGKISARNGAREKWQQYLDLKITQDVPDFLGLGVFQFSLDILNVANLLSSSWGKVETAGLGTYNIVALQGTVTNNGVANTPVYGFSKPANNSVYTINDIASRWRMQLGVRYTL